MDIHGRQQLILWPFVPKWLKNDVVLRQIAGLSGLRDIKQENFSETWERLRREFEEREKLRPKSSSTTSGSSFTNFEDNDPGFDNSAALIHQQLSQQDFMANKILEDNDCPSSSLSVLPNSADDSYRAFIDFMA
jgi:hypothetical protein